jgi:hypothetical protein
MATKGRGPGEERRREIATRLIASKILASRLHCKHPKGENKMLKKMTVAALIAFLQTRPPEEEVRTIGKEWEWLSPGDGWNVTQTRRIDGIGTATIGCGQYESEKSKPCGPKDKGARTVTVLKL